MLHFGIGPRPIGKATIHRWANDFVVHGTWTRPKRERKRRSDKMSARDRRVLKSVVDAEPRLYLDEIQRQLRDHAASSGKKYAMSTIYRTLTDCSADGIGYSLTALRRKASLSSRRERERFLRGIAGIGAHCLVFVDETHKDRRAARRSRGWSPRGKETNVTEHFAQDMNYTLIAAANIEGIVRDACEVFDVNVDGEIFCTWFENFLAPNLGSFVRDEKNSVVILDNCSLHHVHLSRLKAVAAEYGAIIIFLSVYSPKLNPMEAAFHQIKAALKRSELEREGGAAPYALLQRAIAGVTAANMRGYYRQAGIAAPEPISARTAAMCFLVAYALSVVDR